MINHCVALLQASLLWCSLWDQSASSSTQPFISSGISVEHLNARFSLSLWNPIFLVISAVGTGSSLLLCHTRWVCIVAQIMQTGLIYWLWFTGSNWAVKQSTFLWLFCISVMFENALFFMPLSAVFPHHHDDPLGDLPPDSPSTGPPPSGAVSLAACSAPVLSHPIAAPSPTDTPHPLQIQRQGWAGPHHPL